MPKLFIICLAVALSTLVATRPAPAFEHCSHCGCCNNLRKVCRCVPETKEVVEVCWDAKCEDFCVPGCSTKCGVVHECDDCGSWCRTIWKPGCAHVRTKHVPVKTEVKRKIQTYKWEVVTICDGCCHRCASNLTDLNPAQRVAATMERIATGENPTSVPSPVVQATAVQLPASTATLRR